MTTKLTLIAETIDNTGKTTESVAVISQDLGDTWGPQMLLFMKLLKAQGFVFKLDAHIGVMDYNTDTFISAQNI